MRLFEQPIPDNPARRALIHRAMLASLSFCFPDPTRAAAHGAPNPGSYHKIWLM